MIVACWDSLANHDLLGIRSTQYSKLNFAPSIVTSGCGLIAAGGQSGELALKSASPSSKWCHQITEGSNINNSIHIAPSPLSSTSPRLLVSNNDETVKIFEVNGRIPDFKRARRRREKEWEREGGWGERKAERREDEDGMSFQDYEDDDIMEEDVEEEGVHDEGGECTLEKMEVGEIKLSTAVNHCEETSLSLL